MAEAGFGLAILPESSLEEELRTGTLRAIDAPALTTTIPVALIRRRTAFQTGAAQALAAALTDWPHKPGTYTYQQPHQVHHPGPEVPEQAKGPPPAPSRQNRTSRETSCDGSTDQPVQHARTDRRQSSRRRSERRQCARYL